MGLFSFIKESGKKLFGDEEKEAAASQAKMEATAREARAAQTRYRQRKLEDELDRLGLAIEGRRLELDGSRVTVHGTVQSPADRERVVLALGNVAGIEEVNDELTVAGSGTVEGTAGAAAGDPRFHTVVKGDTLSGLAKRYYGDPNRYSVIFEANRPMLEDPDKIYVGQTLRIPTDPRIG